MLPSSLVVAPALARLGTVPADRFDDAKAEVVSAWLDLSAVGDDSAGGALTGVVATRIQWAVDDAISLWQLETVSKFNEIVEAYRLNEVVDDLPNFADPGSFNVLSFGARQVDAIQRWSTASVHLHQIWDVYKSVASFKDYELGPTDADEPSMNLFTGCVLGDPVTFGNLNNVSVVLASMSFRGNRLPATRLSVRSSHRT